MNYLYKNGKELCQIQQLIFYKGNRKKEKVRTLYKDYYVEDPKETDKVTFTVPIPLLVIDDISNYEIHLNNGRIYNILITEINSGIDTSVKAVIGK